MERRIPDREREGVMKNRFTSFLTVNDVNIKVVLNGVVLNSSNDVIESDPFSKDVSNTRDTF
jgi:hypothetical protein